MNPWSLRGQAIFWVFTLRGKKDLPISWQQCIMPHFARRKEAGLVRSLNTKARWEPHSLIRTIEPYRNIEKDRTAAKKTDTLLNRLFIEPLLGMGYPVKDLKILQRLEKFYRDGDSARLAFDMDFTGLQNYTRELVRHAPFMPFIKARIIKAEKRNVETTQMSWEVHPPAIYQALMRWSEYKNLKEIIVTENGAAFVDQCLKGEVKDPKRLNFIKDHIGQVLLARKAGARVNGYFVWTLLDNFEWAEGYEPKFGLVHVNFKTQERIVKDSGKWYAALLEMNYPRISLNPTILCLSWSQIFNLRQAITSLIFREVRLQLCSSLKCPSLPGDGKKVFWNSDDEYDGNRYSLSSRPLPDSSPYNWMIPSRPFHKPNHYFPKMSRPENCAGHKTDKRPSQKRLQTVEKINRTRSAIPEIHTVKLKW